MASSKGSLKITVIPADAFAVISAVSARAVAVVFTGVEHAVVDLLLAIQPCKSIETRHRNAKMRESALCDSLSGDERNRSLYGG